MGYPLDTSFCFWQIAYPIDVCLMEYFYCVDSNQIMFAFCLTWDGKIAIAFKAVAVVFFFQSGKLNVNNV